MGGEHWGYATPETRRRDIWRALAVNLVLSVPGWYLVSSAHELLTKYRGCDASDFKKSAAAGCGDYYLIEDASGAGIAVLLTLVAFALIVLLIDVAVPGIASGSGREVRVRTWLAASIVGPGWQVAFAVAALAIA